MAAMTPETKAKRTITTTIQQMMAEAGILPVPLVTIPAFDPSAHYYALRNTPNAMGMGSGGKPDITLSFGGIVVELEIKAKTNTPSRLQEIWLAGSAATGNHAWVIWGDNPHDMAWFTTHLASLIAGKREGVPLLKLARTRG